MTHIEVLVVGACPAGATAALNLAPTRRVLLVDFRSQSDLDSGARPMVGESLAPAARRLLKDMGLLDSFLEQGHAPCYGNRSVWGGNTPVETDFVRDPDGHGWHLNRGRFERWLRQIAIDRGASLTAAGRVESVERNGGGWSVRLSAAGHSETIQTRFLIDAGGKLAPLARRLGARRQTAGRMLCHWMSGTAKTSRQVAGFTFVEAVEEGWWYTAPLPLGKRIVAFHTDPDLPAAHTTRSLFECARAAPGLAAILDECMFSPEGSVNMTVASGSALRPCAAAGWLAIGDAAVNFDPLSAQGLLNALFTGLAGAVTADQSLDCDEGAIERYARTISEIKEVYDRNRDLWYRLETRWPNSPFWRNQAGTRHCQSKGRTPAATRRN
jgi:flavin-dependent dehydrogenase